MPTCTAFSPTVNVSTILLIKVNTRSQFKLSTLLILPELSITNTKSSKSQESVNAGAVAVGMGRVVGAKTYRDVPLSAAITVAACRDYDH